MLNKIKLSHFWMVLFLLGFSQFSIAQTLKWTEVAPGVWKTIIGTPEAFDLFKAAEIQPNTEALKKLGT